MKATRKLDWQQFYASQDRHSRRLLACIAAEVATREKLPAR
jgi:hypothetical protein